MTIQQPRSKAQRVRELLASLPDDCGIMPASALDADENPVTMHEDGTTLHGRAWLLPQDLEADDDAMGLLEYRKGCTPLTLPTLEPTPPP